MNRPFKGGLLLKGAYTLSKSENMADDDGWVGLTFNTPSQIGRNYALAGFDRTHNFQMGFVYQLPLRGSGAYDGILKAIAADWQVSGVFAAFSGRPFTVTANGASVNTPSNQQTGTWLATSRTSGRLATAAPTTIRPRGRPRRASRLATRAATSSVDQGG